MVQELTRPTDLDPGMLVLEQALKQLKKRAPAYERYHAYYIGEQPLTYSSEKYEDTFAKMVAQYTENMCPVVVDAVADRLIVTGFDAESDSIAQAAWDLWERNRMDERAGQVHTEALKAGDSYVIVWPDIRDPSLIRIWPQDGNDCTVHYAEETAEIDWAAKWWIRDEDGRGRLTLYFPDRIERYLTRNKLSAFAWPVRATGFELLEVTPNPFGSVPVFHFSNNSRISMWGTSELKDVLPIQDALNKSVCDMLVTMEFNAFPQRWATGIQIKIDPATGRPVETPWKPGVDRVWTTPNENAQFGQFISGDLNQMLNTQAKFKNAIADVTGTPSHYLQMTPTQWPSGESLKTAETRFVAKIVDRQISFGNTWEDVMKFALELRRIPVDRIRTVWKDASPRSDMETLNQGILKKQLGIPDKQIQKELGYTDEQINEMAEEKEEQSRMAIERQQQLFNSGRPPEDEV